MALPRADAYLYLAFAAVCTLWVGCLFNSSIRLQTLYAGLWNNPDSFGPKVQAGALGEWSARLDDVFIHFDFARATARGHPFEWSEGNGYSSGGTSLLYPFVLAIGYFVTPKLMGGDRDQMVAMVLDHLVQITLEWKEAAAISTILLVITIGGYLLYLRIAGFSGVFSGGRK